MFGGAAPVHALPLAARCVQAVQPGGDSSRHLFLLGTSDIRENNQVSERSAVKIPEETSDWEWRLMAVLYV